MRHFQEHLFDDVILLLQGNNFKRYFSTKQDKYNIQDFRIINKKTARNIAIEAGGGCTAFPKKSIYEIGTF